MRDFIGLNGHTVQFKPKLYAPVTKLVRDYHPLKWDVGNDTSFLTTFPLARNRVDWNQVYGSWVKEGMRVNASILFDDMEAKDWKDMAHDAEVYGEAFAKAFGPSAQVPLVESAEIRNEPGKYSDADYRTIFEAMACGFRKGDPKLRIAPCAVNLGPSGRYSKSVDCLAGLESLYDVVNIHIYPEVEGWPTWKRSYPEDPKIKFLEHLRSVLTWRGEHAKGKEVWLTEFGWDASTKTAPPTGTFAKWVGNTDKEQAQWIVRGWMVLAREGVDRAYLYFFNDEDKPSVHASSGLTRNFQPKPSFHATAWLQRSLGDYRFSRVVREDAADCYAYEFVHGSDAQKRVIAVWKPTGADAKVTVPAKGRVVKSERMPLQEGNAEAGDAAMKGEALEVTAGETPALVWIEG